MFSRQSEGTQSGFKRKKRQHDTIRQKMKNPESDPRTRHVNGTVQLNSHLSSIPSTAQLAMAPTDFSARKISLANAKDEDSKDEEDIATPDFGGNYNLTDDEKGDSENTDDTHWDGQCP